MNDKNIQEELTRLRESEEHYRTLLDESSDPTFSFLPDGTYRYVNKAFAKGTGFPVEKIIGYKIWDVFEKDEADKRFAVVKKVFAEGISVEIEVRVPLPAGDTYYLTTAKPIKDEAGTVKTVICTSKNITKRKIAEMELQAEHDKLHAAQDEINTLSGLLPICANCKKIRDDKGYWDQIEIYISKTTQAVFTHTICPTCQTDLYPELYPPDDNE